MLLPLREQGESNVARRWYKKCVLVQPILPSGPFGPHTHSTCISPGALATDPSRFIFPQIAILLDRDAVCLPFLASSPQIQGSY